MARMTPPLSAKKASQHVRAVNSQKISSFRSTIKQHSSPSTDPVRTFDERALKVRNTPYKRPGLATQSKLSPVREENPRVTDADTTCDFNFFRNFGSNAPSDAEESSDLGTDFDGWDDEITLVAKLQDNFVEFPEKERLAALAEALEEPMHAKGELLKQYLAHTVAPAAKKVKDIHNLLEEKIDNILGISVISFDDACKKIEHTSLRDEDTLKTSHLECQRNVKDLFLRLTSAYNKRDEYWQSLRCAIDRAEAKEKASLSSLATEIEDVIAKIDKQAKESSKASGLDGKTKEKLLRELLAEI